MGTRNWKRGDYIWTIGQVTDRLIRDLREQTRVEREKEILSAFENAQDQFAARETARGKESGNGAPVDDDHSHLTATIRGNDGGTKT